LPGNKYTFEVVKIVFGGPTLNLKSVTLLKPDPLALPSSNPIGENGLVLLGQSCPVRVKQEIHKAENLRV